MEYIDRLKERHPNFDYMFILNLFKLNRHFFTCIMFVISNLQVAQGSSLLSQKKSDERLTALEEYYWRYYFYAKTSSAKRFGDLAPWFRSGGEMSKDLMALFNHPRLKVRQLPNLQLKNNGLLLKEGSQSMLLSWDFRTGTFSVNGKSLALSRGHLKDLMALVKKSLEKEGSEGQWDTFPILQEESKWAKMIRKRHYIVGSIQGPFAEAQIQPVLAVFGPYVLFLGGLTALALPFFHFLVNHFEKCRNKLDKEVPDCSTEGLLNRIKAINSELPVEKKIALYMSICPANGSMPPNLNLESQRVLALSYRKEPPIQLRDLKNVTFKMDENEYTCTFNEDLESDYSSKTCPQKGAYLDQIVNLPLGLILKCCESPECRAGLKTLRDKLTEELASEVKKKQEILERVHSHSKQ